MLKPNFFEGSYDKKKYMDKQKITALTSRRDV